MRTIEVDDDVYQFIASKTEVIGESASDILRRLLGVSGQASIDSTPVLPDETETSVTEMTSDAYTEEKPVVEAPVFNPVATPEPTEVSGSVVDVLEADEEFKSLNSTTKRFLYILGTLYQRHQDTFLVCLAVKGKGRLYFATSEQELLKSGSSTRPKPIPGSDYWVITNSNTTRKQLMITEVCQLLGYEEPEIDKLMSYL